jgi:hypothetical protein
MLQLLKEMIAMIVVREEESVEMTQKVVKHVSLLVLVVVTD